MPSPVHPYSDYGVAMRTLKSARGWLGLLLFVCVATQFLGFALMWWTTQPYVGMKGQWKSGAATQTVWQRLVQDVRSQLNATQPSTAPAAPPEDFFPGTAQGHDLNIRTQWDGAYTALVAATQLASLIAVLSQAIIVFVTLLVVLIAQAPGVAHMTRSLIWSVLLLFMFLPWQSVFAREFPIPGVVYNYTELTGMIGKAVVGEHVSGFEIWMIYGRFIAWPLLGLLVLLITSERYRAGVMIAIGHPLQSMLQPRGSGGPVGTGGGPGGMALMGSGEKRLG